MSETRFELLLPSEIRSALAERSVVDVPLGAFEWHGEHLPVGLDGLTAHDLCLAAARRDGGLVLPPLYYGTGGEHGAYPWTIMVEEADLRPLLQRTLARLESFGVGPAVLFSGHFAGAQLKVLGDLEAEWRGRHLRVRGLAVSMPRLQIAPDHAALFETTLLNALRPDRVHLELLPPLRTAPAMDPGGDATGAQRHVPSHPLYGIFGPDPRSLDPAAAVPLRDALVDWLLSEVASLRT